MTVHSFWLDLDGGADGCILPFSAALVLVDVTGALASDWTSVEYVCWLFVPLDIRYVFSACLACEFPALSTLLDAERL